MGRPRTVFEGDIFTNISGLKYKVVKYLGNKQYTVEFLDTGYSIEANGGNVKAGKVKDMLNKTVGGIGHRGNPRDYARREYDAWKNMIYRVRNIKEYEDVTICDRWLVLENFLEDIPKLENYAIWLQSPSETWALDKDIKYKGNRVYSPSACMFVTISDNSKAVPHKSVTTYIGTNKELDLTIEFCNQRQFSLTYGLCYKNVSRSINKGGTTKGWSFKIQKD